MRKESLPEEVQMVFKRALPDVYLIDDDNTVISSAAHNRNAALPGSVLRELCGAHDENFLTADNYVARTVRFDHLSDLRLVMVERLSVRNRLSTTQVKYNMSREEFEVLARLVAGANVREIASELQIPYSSARTHAKDVFRKTSTKNSADLFKLLLGEAG